MPNILIAGAPTGCWTNLGDEAIFASMAADLRSGLADAELTVVSSSPAGFFERYGASEVHYEDLGALVASVQRSDLVVLGGGSIFFDYWPVDPDDILTPRHQGLSLWTGLALLAAANDVPVAIYGAGVGPLDTVAGERMTAAAFDVASVATVRDRGSRDRVVSLGVDPDRLLVTGDPVLSSRFVGQPVVGQPVDPTEHAPRADGATLGVAVRQWDFGVDPDRWVAEVADGIDRWVERTAGRVLFVPCHRSVAWPLTDDRAAAVAVHAKMTSSGPVEIVDPEQPWERRAELLASCDAVLAMRYHAALIALGAGVPTVALSYDPKVAALFADWGLSEQLVALEDARGDGLASRLEAAESTAARDQAEAARGMAVVEERGTIEAVVSVVRDPGIVSPGRALRTLLSMVAPDVEDRPAAATAALETLRQRTGPARVGILTNNVLDLVTAQPFVGGAERYGRDLADLMRDLGLAPEFFQAGIGEWTEGDFYGYPVTALDKGAVYSEFEPGVADAFFAATADFDHVVYLMPNYASGHMRDDALLVIHGIWWDHDLWPHLSLRTDEWYSHLEAALSGPRRIVSVDANSINVVRALYPALAERMVLVPSGVDTTSFAPGPERSSPVPQVIIPRRAEVHRGAYLVPEIVDLVTADCRITWVGTGHPDAERGFRDLAERDGRFSQRRAGFDEMPDIYRAADIVVIPTLASEGQSLSCLEAMATGCAVVVTRVGGLSELVDDGVDGLVCEPTAQSLAAAIQRLIVDEDLRRRLGRAARHTAQRRSLDHWRWRWAQVLVDDHWVPQVVASSVAPEPVAPVIGIDPQAEELASLRHQVDAYERSRAQRISRSLRRLRNRIAGSPTA